MNILSEKFKEVLYAFLPVTLIVIILKLTLVPIDNNLMWKFMFGSFIVVIGLTFFLIGVDLGITPLGVLLGPIITKRNKLWIVVISAFVLGFIISFAEPSLLILGNQIGEITMGAISSSTILVVVSLGIGIFMILGFLRLIYNLPLNIIIIISYGIVLILSIFTSPEFLAIAFDASGATTGVLAVPFILSISLGITSMKKDSKASEKDSFGLVSIVSIGAIISIMILNLVTHTQEYAEVLSETAIVSNSFGMEFLYNIPSTVKESLYALLPLIIIFVVVFIFSNTLSKGEIRRIAFGFLYALIGLSLFFLGVNNGFMEVGTVIGSYLTTLDSYLYLIVVGFLLGVVTILAEPAVYVMTHQIEDVTSGYVKRRAVLIALSLGVGVAVALSVLRIVVTEIQLWHYLLPGYVIAIALTFFVPKMFIGIAFDAGGVATGPMTATFILAFINGAANKHTTASILIDGFGMIAMVALMPIITLQLLGVSYKIKTSKKEVHISE